MLMVPHDSVNHSRHLGQYFRRHIVLPAPLNRFHKLPQESLGPEAASVIPRVLPELLGFWNAIPPAEASSCRAVAEFREHSLVLRREGSLPTTLSQRLSDALPMLG